MNKQRTNGLIILKDHVGEARKEAAKIKQANKAKDRSYKNLYGISLNQYNQMFIDQLGCCAICNRHQSEFKKALFVDHDHLTGTVRGLLCVNCNRLLGNAKDNTEILLKSITYLKGVPNG